MEKLRQSANVFEARRVANIGYVLFNDHIRTAESLLINEMTAFRDANISELVLDLRYNDEGHDSKSGRAFDISEPVWWPP